MYTIQKLNKNIHLLIVLLFSAISLIAQDPYVGDFTATGDIKSESNTFVFGDTQNLKTWVNG